MTDTTCPKNPGGEHFFKKGAFADSPIRCTYCGIKPGTQGDTNPSERDELMVMLVHGGAASNSIAKWRVDRHAVEVREQVLSEVADLLMRADETAAALLVDRLREAGESRG